MNFYKFSHAKRPIKSAKKERIVRSLSLNFAKGAHLALLKKRAARRSLILCYTVIALDPDCILDQLTHVNHIFFSLEFQSYCENLSRIEITLNSSPS